MSCPPTRKPAFKPGGAGIGRCLLARIRSRGSNTNMSAWAYLAAWDVRRAKLFGRCEARTGIAAFDRLVAQTISFGFRPTAAA